ncbi:MAG: RDD family protein [Gammaproteobacteria bacterium]
MDRRPEAEPGEAPGGVKSVGGSLSGEASGGGAGRQVGGSAYAFGGDPSGDGLSDSSDLVVDSVTGVDVSLPIAGPGVRAYAFVIDWHIRALLFVAWYVIAALIYNGRWSLAAPVDASAGWFGLVLLPGAAIYLLYHMVLEIAMRGRTPGKRMAGVRLVTRNGSSPAVPAYLTRNVFRLIDSFPLLYGVGLVATVVTKNHVRVGDLAAGTLLVYDRENESVLEHVNSAALGARLDGSTAELVNDLLIRWTSLDEEVRQRLARTLLGRLLGAQTDWAALGDSALREQLVQFARGADR